MHEGLAILCHSDLCAVKSHKTTASQEIGPVNSKSDNHQDMYQSLEKCEFSFSLSLS